MARRQTPAAPQQPRDGGGKFDPVYEWLDDGGSYLLRLDLPEFKNENFRVHVDAAGRLIVLGQRAPGGAGSGKALQLHKVFQLPNTANLDAITGRFDGTVLTLTVPKLLQSDAVELPASLPEAKGEEDADEPKDLQEDKAAKAGSDAETERRIEAERASLTVRSKEVEEDDPKAKAPPPYANTKGPHRDQEIQDEKARAADHRAKVAREAARRVEAWVAETKAKAERERKSGRWKECAAEKGLKLAEAVGKKKEVIATAVAAFTLGVFVSHRLFARN
ncbi:stress response protein NST1-like [Phragmites australis]|uniref:stress response protein NST1-like n=1 Tax=Phragmites australis TaxID=29695 RepID=UPI002D781634|nr:stress response protein NST1-like [Phragmites australis]